ncbi:MAG: valine--tRNA ligase [Erysipelotrichales bacterium]|nr:valine--tRNA ligase [Erysipelotrichales bacterium]
MALSTRYNPKEVEKGKYEFWKNKGYFKAGEDLTKTKFSMVIPPPNVTGKLHLGHAINTTIQDIVARYKKAKGYDVLWVPGMDHAGIATQAKVEAKLRSEGISRYDLGREKFLEKAWEWKREYAESIHEQWSVMGLSLDYSRERFTLDEGLNRAVRKVFVDLYNKGLIYQGEKIINWDPVQRTALSNIEVIYKDDEGEFFYFKYPIVGTNEHLIVATTRPETMFGDTCVIVNPKDERYKHLIGEYCINPANGDKLPILGDEYVDIEFGTGAMKCTPAHDPNDFKIGEKYGFKPIICMNEDATMNSVCGKYEGLDRFECRKQLVEQIKLDGNLIKIEKITHQVGHSERSDAVVEPYLSKQWFVKMRPLADQALKNQTGDKAIAFYPDRFNKVFTSWMEKVDDWCISRQLWWGHRIPAYYHKVTKEVLVSVEPPKDIENWVQDEDILDTWFSSALWPFTTLGWPEKTSDFERYFPLDLMVTAYDIIFFWVSRMIFQSLEFTKEPPFNKVLIHGIIRDSQGRKMSKSLGNGVDPIDVIEKYGADALRYFITTTGTPGQDSRYIEEKVESSANYINKIWNAARFVLGVLPSEFKERDIKAQELNPLDKYIMAKLETTIESVVYNMDRYELGNASTHLYNFVYDDFCSWYLEMAKVTLNGDNELAKENTYQVLFKVLKAVILMIYPYTPFVSEELYLNLPEHKESIMLEDYPIVDNSFMDKKAIEEVETLFKLIKDIRNYKVENELAPNAKIKLHVFDKAEVFKKYLPYLERFTFASEIIFEKEEDNLKDFNVFIYDIAQFGVEDNIDKETILAKLNAELSIVEKEISRAEGMLSNPNFVSKAPESKVNAEKEKLENHKNRKAILLEKIQKLK